MSSQFCFDQQPIKCEYFSISVPKEDFEVPKSNFEMDQYLNFDIQSSENFTILMFAYEISQFSKEESDFLLN